MKTAVVTGATSFLGIALIKELVNKNYRVIGIVREGSANLHKLDGVPGIEVVACSLENIQRLPETTDRADVFFHFGWDGSGSAARQDAGVQKKNFDYSMNALEAAQRLGCKTFIFAGSQAEYGKCSSEIKETQACYPLSEYGKNKYRFGKEGFYKAKQYGIKFVHLRIFSVYGFGDRPGTLVDSCMDTFHSGGEIELGKCEQEWNYLYVDDFADMIVKLAEAEIKNDIEEDCIFNVAGTETKPLYQFVEEIYNCFGKRGDYLLGVRGENAEGSPSIMPNIHKISERIGTASATSFSEGIRKIMTKKFGKRCIICGSNLGNKPLASFPNMPASAQNIPTEDELSGERAIDLDLFQCPQCGLVQFDCEPVDYYKDVIRSGGFTTTMTELRRRQYEHLIEKYHLEEKKILEVGCGRGEFLGVLNEFNVEAWGIENKAELVDIAKEQGLNVVQGFITDEECAIKEKGPFAAFLSFNFLEHQPDPNAMLQKISENLDENGVGLITVPSFEYILQYDGYYELIRDHIAYYTFDTLRFLVNKNGFEVLEEEMINRDTLSVVVRKRRKMDVAHLVSGYENIKKQFDEFLEQCKAQGKKAAIWGASHQGFTIASSLKLGSQIEYIIDSAPFKQNKYAPSSHIPIVSPEEYFKNPVGAIIIIAPGYTEEIAQIIRDRFSKDIELVTLRTERIERL